MNKYLPGRLGNPAASLLDDPRGDPRIQAALELAGGLADGVPPVGVNPTYEECLAYCEAFEAAGAATHPMQLELMPAFTGVSTRTEVIKGVDDNDITLYIHQPVDHDPGVSPLPCIVHTHGGGMVVMSAQDPVFVRLRSSLAETGIVVVGVEFRNGGGKLGPHPFPAGLNDCASAAQWVYANKATLGISTIAMAGESGGGNLSIAVTLKAKQDGWLEQINGVYAMCPYICGAYANPPAELLSLQENNGYLLDCEMMAAMVKTYDPEGDHGDNPLAWPLAAGVEDLAGLPPHVISVNELDPLRDEGLAFYRKLLGAGVSAVARTANGTPHAGDTTMPDVTPDVFAETLRSIHGFVSNL